MSGSNFTTTFLEHKVVNQTSGTIRLWNTEGFSYRNGAIEVPSSPYIMIVGESHLQKFKLEAYLVVKMIMKASFFVNEMEFFPREQRNTDTDQPLYVHFILKDGKLIVRLLEHDLMDESFFS
jgi:hypothetical protein